MSRFKIYAVVDVESDKIIGRFVYDTVAYKNKLAVNDRTAEMYWDGQLITSNKVKLSSIKKYIEKLTHVEPVFHSEAGILVNHR